MKETGSCAIWPVLPCKDARAAVAFLKEAFGFEEVLVVPDDDDPEAVVHAELRWPGGGGIMLGSSGKGNEPFSSLPAGVASIYVATDQPDQLYARASGAGAEVARELRDEDYGSRGFTVRDPEGNLWSFGTYVGS